MELAAPDGIVLNEAGQDRDGGHALVSHLVASAPVSTTSLGGAHRSGVPRSSVDQERRRIATVEWQWTDDPKQGVLIDDTGTPQRIVVVREPVVGENGSGHVFAQGLAFADQWFDTLDAAIEAAESSLPET